MQCESRNAPRVRFPVKITVAYEARSDVTYTFVRERRSRLATDLCCDSAVGGSRIVRTPQQQRAYEARRISLLSGPLFVGGRSSGATEVAGRRNVLG